MIQAKLWNTKFGLCYKYTFQKKKQQSHRVCETLHNNKASLSLLPLTDGESVKRDSSLFAVDTVGKDMAEMYCWEQGRYWWRLAEGPRLLSPVAMDTVGLASAVSMDTDNAVPAVLILGRWAQPLPLPSFI